MFKANIKSIDELVKARSHKYIKRTGASGKYEYLYREPEGKTFKLEGEPTPDARIKALQKKYINGSVDYEHAFHELLSIGSKKHMGLGVKEWARSKLDVWQEWKVEADKEKLKQRKDRFWGTNKGEVDWEDPETHKMINYLAEYGNISIILTPNNEDEFLEEYEELTGEPLERNQYKIDPHPDVWGKHLWINFPKPDFPMTIDGGPPVTGLDNKNSTYSFGKKTPVYTFHVEPNGSYSISSTHLMRRLFEIGFKQGGNHDKEGIKEELKHKNPFISGADKSFQIEEPFKKARSHKYIKRVGAPKAYRYVYKFPLKSSTYDEFTEKIQRHATKNARAIQELEGKTFKMERPFGLHEPTEKEMYHENYRVSTMSERALMARVYKIKDPQKLYAFRFAADMAGYHNIAAMAIKELEKMGYTREGKQFVHPEPPGLLKIKPVKYTAMGYAKDPKVTKKPEIKMEEPFKKPTAFEKKEAKEELKFHEMMEEHRAAKKVRPTANAIMNYISGKIEKIGHDHWMELPLEDRHEQEIAWMKEKFDLSNLSDAQVKKLATGLEDENYHGPAGYFYDLMKKPAVKIEEPFKKPIDEYMKKPYLGGGLPRERVLPAKGQKLQDKGRHIVLGDEPEPARVKASLKEAKELASDEKYEAYRQALLAKDKKDAVGGPKKDKAGNIIAEHLTKPPVPDLKSYHALVDRKAKKVSKEYVEKRAKKDLKAYLDKEKDPWADMPGYGKVYKMLDPFRR